MANFETSGQGKPISPKDMAQLAIKRAIESAHDPMDDERAPDFSGTLIPTNYSRALAKQRGEGLGTRYGAELPSLDGVGDDGVHDWEATQAVETPAEMQRPLPQLNRTPGQR